MQKVPVKGFENYIVYEDGRVKNLDTNRFLKGSLRLHGYLVYRLSKNNKKYQFYAHRLVAEAFIPNPLNLTIVNHIDGDKLNNNVSNLEWCTQSDNMAHAHAHSLIKERAKPIVFQGPIDSGEMFKPIDGFSHYLVSSYGRVINKDTKRVLRPSIVCGYYKVRLSSDGKVKDCLLHYLVQESFNNRMPEKGKECIDHRDGNKLNNRADNLRVVTLSENTNEAFYSQKTNSSLVAVDYYSLKGEYLGTFDSCKEAGRKLGLDSSSISKVARGERKSCGGFIFKKHISN